MKPIKINASSTMKKIMADYFLDLDAAVKDDGRKVAWCTSVGPAELLHAFGFAVFYPENHSAMLGATRTATEYIPYGNALGYSPEICSYLTADIGAFVKDFTPLNKAFGIESIPKPDVLVYNTNQCRDVQDWFMWYSRRWDVPCIGVETHRNIGKVNNSHLHSVKEQFQSLVPHLEKITATKFDIDILREKIELSRKTSNLWEKVLRTAEAKPSPVTFFDGTIHMGPAVVLRGTKTAVDYYTELLNELQDRVKNKTAAVEKEKLRLYWDGMPVWGRLRDLSTLFTELNTCVVASTYCNSWIFNQLDPNNPFESMAKAYTELFIVRDDEIKENYIQNMFKDYSVDGVIYHDAKTCPNNSNNRYGMAQRLYEKTEVPYLVINGDLNDLRCYSDDQTKTNIEAFIEQLED